MKQNEVVDTLNAIIHEITEEGEFMCDYKYLDDVTTQLAEAIKAVELMPELVEALEILHELLKRHYAFGIIDTTAELLKKAKGKSDGIFRC